MKKLMYTLIAVVAVTFTVSAQRTASTVSEEEFKIAAEDNTYMFYMPGNVSNDLAMFHADALTEFMEVEFDEDRQEMKIHLLTGHIREKEQVKRILYGVGMERIEIDGMEMDIMDFAQDYIEIE